MKIPRVVALLLFIGQAVACAGEGSINVDVVGTLHTGIFAIGGETTGATITAKGITWELNLGKKLALREAAEKLDGKSVRVRGSLERRPGVEIKERWIVTVSGLEVADGEVAKPDLHATLKRAGGRIGVVAAGEKTVIDITCKSGINSATVRRNSKLWPKSILVRLHLKGLEMFHAGGKAAAVEWSVSSSGKHASRVSLRQGNQETPIKMDSPYFTELRIVGGDGKIPLKDGYFEIPLPAKLFDGNPEELTLKWIDFYR